MRKGTIGVMVASLALAGCYQAQKPSTSVKPDGAYARVRITYEDERSTIRVFGGKDCGAARAEDAAAALVSPHMTIRESMTLQRPAATSLGMPTARETPRVYYEYYLRANAPARIQVTYDAQSVNPNVVMVSNPVCTRSAVFVPMAGKDYEIRPTGTCAARVKELVATASGAGEATAVDVPVRVCPKSD